MANAFESLALYQRPDAHEVRALIFGEVAQFSGSSGCKLDGPHED